MRHNFKNEHGGRRGSNTVSFQEGHVSKTSIIEFYSDFTQSLLANKWIVPLNMP